MSRQLTLDTNIEEVKHESVEQESKKEEEEEGETQNIDAEFKSTVSILNSINAVDKQGELRNPIEELIEQTIMESPIYNTRESLLNPEDPSAVLFWAKTISSHAKRMKQYYLRKKKEQEKDKQMNEHEPFGWNSNQIVIVIINFHATAIEKFEFASKLDPSRSFREIEPIALASPTTTAQRSRKFPTLELAYEWGIAALRYGKALEKQNDYHAAYTQYNNSAKLFLRVVQEDRRRKWTGKVFNKIVVVFECLAKVKPTSTDVRTYCDLFLVQYSNIAMRGEMKKGLNIKPLVAMVLSDCRHVKEANAIEVVRHLATFFANDVANEAATQLKNLDVLLAKSTEREENFRKELSVEAKKRLAQSGLKKDEYINNIEILKNILQWKGKPPCRLSFTYTPIEDSSASWRKENPRLLYTDKHKITDEEINRNGHVFIARRKADRIPVVVKVMTNYSENAEKIKKEIAILEFTNKHPNFSHLLDVFLFENEVWAVVEYCDAGNLVDIIPVSVMKEPEMAYLCKEILTGLAFLHENNRMHRDLRTDEILLNMSGDVLIGDFELWMGNNLQRYWLPPELLLSEPYPYGTEVDIWSFGCIVMEIADGVPPYCDCHPVKEFFYTATRGAPPLAKASRWSAEFKQFLEECLHPDPSKRSSAAKLLSHKWIQKACTRKEFSDQVQLKVSWTRW